jgi:hypothetical protein
MNACSRALNCGPQAAIPDLPVLAQSYGGDGNMAGRTFGRHRLVRLTAAIWVMMSMQ